MTMIPTVGRVVHYALTETDAAEINRQRDDARRAGPQNSGKIVHVGNPAEAGQICAADVVRVFGGQAANLQVKLDGNDTLWRTSVMPDETSADRPAPGRWIWPPRV
jgi:hypothetical protein